MIDVVLCVSGAQEVRIVHDLARQWAQDVRVVRRCADLTEARAVVAAGIGDVLLVDMGARGLTRDTVAEMQRSAVAVVGFRDELYDPEAASLGIAHFVSHSASTDVLVAEMTRALSSDGSEPEVLMPAPAGEDEVPQESRVIVVWGPAGSPGRSSLVINLGAELAACGVRTTVVDADTYTPALSQMIGVADEAPGIVAACRAASRDTLADDVLENAFTPLHENLALLSGIGVARRWPEVTSTSLAPVWKQLRKRGGVILVDCAPFLEEDEDLSYDTIAPQRNAATLSAIQEADAIIAVTLSDPVMLTRLVREKERLAELTDTPMHVVVNRHSDIVTEHKMSHVLSQRFPAESVHFLPDDPKLARRSSWEGTLWAVQSPRSDLVKKVRSLARADFILGGLPAMGD